MTASELPPRSMESRWREIVSGRSPGIGAMLVRWGLSVVRVPYALGTRLRNIAYDRGWLVSTRLPLPVISVGNLTVGGTGKTPTVAWLVQLLQSLGYHPAIISRGYGSTDEQGNDEKRLLDRLLPGVPHRQNPDRLAAAHALLTEGVPPDILVLDDAFQHRRVQRDIDLLLIDCLNPWGYGHQLPRGLLREAISGMQRARAILLTRSDQIDPENLQALREIIARCTPVPTYMTHFEPVGLVDSWGGLAPLNGWYGREVAAFCGIGNPMGFQRTLVACGYAVPEARFRAFPDHHPYSAADLEQIGEWARSYGAECLLTTAKDMVKIPIPIIRNLPIRAVEIALRMDHEADEVAFTEQMRSWLATTPQGS